MNTQTDETPRTDACLTTPDRGGIRNRTWKVTRLVATSRQLERELAECRAQLASRNQKCPHCWGSHDASACPDLHPARLTA